MVVGVTGDTGTTLVNVMPWSRHHHEDHAGRDFVFIDTTLTMPVVTLQAAKIQRRKVRVQERNVVGIVTSRMDFWTKCPQVSASCQRTKCP